MNLEERKAFLHRLNLTDYLEFVGFVILHFVMLPFLLIMFALIMNAPAEGFIPALRDCTRGLIAVELLLTILGFVFATVCWSMRRLFVWLGWTRTYA